MRKLPIKISLAVGQYYLNSFRAKTSNLHGKMDKILEILSINHHKEVPWFWDKDWDLENITRAAHNHNYHFTASAGSFWFYKKDAKAILYTDTDIYPEVRRVKQVGYTK